MKERWAEAVQKSFPEGHAPGFAGYPLLGEELPDEAVRPADPWKLRLSLCQECSSDQLEGLLDDVQQVHLTKAALSLAGSPLLAQVELFLEQGEGPGWTLGERLDINLGPLSSERLTWRKGGQSLIEQVVMVDKALLRNLAWLRSLPGEHPEVARWVVRSNRSAGGEAEGLIGDTLAYLAGAVGGAGVLEVAQQPGESFDTLWPRLNIPRLLRWEAGLGAPGDALAGAGVFAALGGLTVDA